ncbi:MAG: phospho-N-acetylmuramoyl-pentapeptide-transferase [bacterium]
MIMITVAFLLGLILCLLLGVPYVDLVRKRLFNQYIKDVVPEGHLQKSGTPTTGGVFIVGAIIISSIITLMLAQKLNTTAFIILITLFFYTLAGFQDDFLKIKGKANKGLSAKGKFLRQVAIALLPALFVTLGHYTSVTIGYNSYELGWFYPILAVFIITGASNAYNLTDGLDGLAASTGIPTFLGCTIIAELLGAHEIAIISATVAGALLGFLKYNKSKAQIFMGDTGSLAIGSLLGTLAVIGKFEFALIVLAGIFVIETMSVIIQVISFKTTGKRVFKMSPIHHHFELEGWSENQIVVRFALLSLFFSAIALLSFLALYYGWV